MRISDWSSDVCSSDLALCSRAREIGREFVIKAIGKVVERSNKNPKLPTGEIEIKVGSLEILNASKVPPFIIEEETDGGEDLRAKYRSPDLRPSNVRRNLEVRHTLASKTRRYLDREECIEVATPILRKSNPTDAQYIV